MYVPFSRIEWTTWLIELADHRGNSWLIGVCAFNCFILYPGVKAYYIWRNKSRDRIWDNMTPEVRLPFSLYLSSFDIILTYPSPVLQQKSEYLTTTKDRGNRRLDFRFAH